MAQYRPRVRTPHTPFDGWMLEKGIHSREIAISLGVSEAAVKAWRIGRQNMKPAYAREVNRKFGVPLHVMRPDTWDAPDNNVTSPRKAA